MIFRYGEDDYEYEVSDDELKEALAFIIASDYFSKECKQNFNELKKGVALFLEDIDIDEIAKTFEDVLYEYFEERADDQRELEREAYDMQRHPSFYLGFKA